MLGMVQGLSQLHALGIAHRDVKLDNFFVHCTDPQMNLDKLLTGDLAGLQVVHVKIADLDQAAQLPLTNFNKSQQQPHLHRAMKPSSS